MTNDKPIRFRCSGCGKTLTAKPAMAGRALACPACKSVVTVPPPSPLPSQIADEMFGDWLTETLADDPLPPPPSRPPSYSLPLTRKTPLHVGWLIGGGVGIFLLLLVTILMMLGSVTHGPSARVGEDALMPSQPAARVAVIAHLLADDRVERSKDIHIYPMESLDNSLVYVGDFSTIYQLQCVPFAHVQRKGPYSGFILVNPNLRVRAASRPWEGGLTVSDVEQLSRRLAAAKKLWGLRVEFTTYEDFGWTSVNNKVSMLNDRIFLLNEHGVVLGSLLTEDVRSGEPGEVANWFAKHPDPDKVISDAISAIRIPEYTPSPAQPRGSPLKLR